MSGALSQAYVYRPLGNRVTSILDDDFVPSDSFNIRLVELEPAAEFASELQCTIKVVDISNPCNYEAVSYVWGPPHKSSRLFCGSAYIAITSTLDETLRRFRDSASETSTLGRCGLYRPGNYEQEEPVSSAYGPNPLSSPRNEASVTADDADRSIEEELVHFTHKEDMIDAVQRFLALPWFTRRWVIQEALVRPTHFFCGSFNINGHALYHAIFALQKSSLYLDRKVLDNLQHLGWLASVMNDPCPHDGTGILELLVQFGDALSSKDHDLVYAFLGRASDIRSPFKSVRPESPSMPPQLLGTLPTYLQPAPEKGRIPIRVDYDDDLKHFFAEFAEQMFQHKEHREILHCAGAFRSSLGRTTNSLPGWVPDWTMAIRYKPLLDVPWFQAGGPAESGEPFINYPWCSILGFVFGTAGPCLPMKPSENGDHMSLIGEICCNVGMNTGLYTGTGERMWEVLGLTFIADHALSHFLRREYHHEGVINGQLVKRNASERDMHTLLD